MEENALMPKSAKLSQKKNSNTTKSMVANAEQASLPSEKIFDAVPLAIISVNWQGQIQYMNRAAKSLLGEPPSDLHLDEWPKTFGFYLDDGVMPYPAEKLPVVRVLRGETVESGEDFILRKPGSEKGLWISMSGEILRDENGNVDGAIALIRDINYQKQIELSREKHIKRTEALYSFSHAIAEAGNDLRQIMNLVVKFAAEGIGDLSVIALLNPDGSKMKVNAFYDTNSTGQSLLRKVFVPDFEYDPSKTLAGSVIRS